MAESTTKGGCLCGAVQYQLTGKPEFCVYCYCKDCQRSTGSDRFAGAMFTNDALTVTCGATKAFTTHAVSGRTVQRHFCGDCASMLWGQTEMGLVSVCAGTLNDPSVFNPGMVVFTEDAPAHAAIPSASELKGPKPSA